MKVDLHVHASERSGCANESEENQVQAALRAGLNGLALTDHNRLVPAAHLAELNRRYAPLHIFTGIEVDADREHWLVFGVHDSLLERPGWHYPELRDFVRWQGGFIALAHPFRYEDAIHVNIDRFPPDGIELRSYNTPTRRESDIQALAERLGMVTLQNTDAHFAGQIGRYYNELPGSLENDQDLVKTLRGMKTEQFPGLYQAA